MSTTAEQTRPYNKTSTLAPKLSAEDLNNLVTILPKLSEKEQVLLLKELTDMIKKKKPKVRAQDKDPKDLTEEDLNDLLSPGVHIYPFKPKNKDTKNDKDTK